MTRKSPVVRLLVVDVIDQACPHCDGLPATWACSVVGVVRGVCPTCGGLVHRIRGYREDGPMPGYAQQQELFA